MENIKKFNQFLNEAKKYSGAFENMLDKNHGHGDPIATPEEEKYLTDLYKDHYKFVCKGNDDEEIRLPKYTRFNYVWVADGDDYTKEMKGGLPATATLNLTDYKGQIVVLFSNPLTPFGSRYIKEFDNLDSALDWLKKECGVSENSLNNVYSHLSKKLKLYVDNDYELDTTTFDNYKYKK